MEDDKKATSMNLLGIMMFVAVALLLIIVAVSILVGRTKTGNKPVATTGKNTPAEMTPEPTTQVSVLDSMVENGEITGYWQGEELNVVYKYIPSTFDTEDKILGGVVDNDGNFTVELSEFNVNLNMENKWFLDWGTEICDNICHLENDLFIADEYSELRIYNAKTNTATSLSKKTPSNGYTPVSADSYYIRTNIYEGFSDGVIVMVGRNDYGNRIILIFDDGTITPTSLYSEFENNGICGKYHEGLFYFDRKFYNIDCECVIDFSEYDIQYELDNVPIFDDGKCHLMISKNGKLWDTYIDTSGKFIGEPTEHIEKLRENE